MRPLPGAHFDGATRHAAAAPGPWKEIGMRKNLKLAHAFGACVTLLLLLAAAPRHAWAQG